MGTNPGHQVFSQLLPPGGSHFSMGSRGQAIKRHKYSYASGFYKHLPHPAPPKRFKPYDGPIQAQIEAAFWRDASSSQGGSNSNYAGDAPWAERIYSPQRQGWFGRNSRISHQARRSRRSRFSQNHYPARLRKRSVGRTGVSSHKHYPARRYHRSRRR